MFFIKILVYSTGQLIPSNLPEYLAFHSTSNTLVQARLRRSPTAVMAAASQLLARAQADQTRAQVLVQVDLVQASTLPAGHLQGPAMEKSKRPAAWQSRGGQGQGGRRQVPGVCRAPADGCGGQRDAAADGDAQVRLQRFRQQRDISHLGTVQPAGGKVAEAETPLPRH